jgi:recombination protein RecA
MFGAITLAPSDLRLVSLAELERARPSSRLPLFWPELEGILPDRGFPKGVVELASARALGGATQVALAAVRGGQESAGSWCAWLDPEGSLYAPGVVRAGVDLQRLLVVRPPRKDLASVAVKLVEARAFEVVVVDFASPALVRPSSGLRGDAADVAAAATSRRRKKTLRPEVLVRKLALLAGEAGATVVMLTDASEPRPMPWPVALRLELARVPGALTVKVAKDRACRLASGRVAWTRAHSRAHETHVAAETALAAE